MIDKEGCKEIVNRKTSTSNPLLDTEMLETIRYYV
jgi:hypothetical protein